jgi:hypothetical protein
MLGSIACWFPLIVRRHRHRMPSILSGCG